MVSLHSFNDCLVDTEFLQDAATDLYVCPGDLVVHRFADIVEESAGTSHRLVCTKLSCEHCSKMGDFYRVIKNILAVTCAEIKAAKDHEKLWIKIRHFCVVSSLRTFLLDDVIDFLLCFLHRFFD